LNRLVACLSRRSALVICSVVVGLLLPAGLSAFAIKLEHFVHQEITFDGLNPLEGTPNIAPKFELTLDTGAKVKFSVGSINEIVFHNVATDDLQGPLVTRLHFDSEDLAGGSDRLKRLREQIVFNLANAIFLDFSSPDATTERAVRVTNSRALLGRALHTLQDFYAHTNWVERHNFSLTEIDTRLGNAIVPSPAPGTSCDSGEPEVAQLTSGWFLNDKLTAYCGAPENKCAHGSVGCGIHKDINARIGFASAEALAIKATNTYTRETLQAVLAAYTRLVPQLGADGAKQAVRLAVCEFMGVPDAYSTCLTSHTLTVQKVNQAGGGTITQGLVASSSGNITPAIDCGLLCSGVAVAGTEVQLTASDTPPWIFVGWGQGGVCAGSASRTCEVDMTSNQTAKAVYAELAPTELSVTSYGHSCYLENGANIPITCSGVGDPGPNGSFTYHEELHGTHDLIPVSSIIVDGQIANEVGHAVLSGTVEAWAVGQWFARGGQGLMAQYGSSVLVASNTLPLGTPVTVRLAFHVSFQGSLNFALNEPPTVQWYGGLPVLVATVATDIPGQYIGVSDIVNYNEATPLNKTIDLIQQSWVGDTIPIRAKLTADSQTLQAARATVENAFTAELRGPYLMEVNGLDVYFIQSQ